MPPRKPPADAGVSGAAGLISAERLCTLTGLTDRRHRQLAKEGFFPPPIAGMYQLSPAVAGVLRYYRELHQRRDKTMGEKRERKLDNENALLELTLAERQSELVSVDEIVRRLSPALVAARQRIMTSGLAEDERDELLNDLGRIIVDAIKEPLPGGDPPAATDPGTAAEAVDQPMG